MRTQKNAIQTIARSTTLTLPSAFGRQDDLGGSLGRGVQTNVTVASVTLARMRQAEQFVSSDDEDTNGLLFLT